MRSACPDAATRRTRMAARCPLYRRRCLAQEPTAEYPARSTSRPYVMPLLIDDPALLAANIAEAAQGRGQPFIVAIDGRSGSGKSTLAHMLAKLLDATVIEGDDFYAGGTALRDDSPAARAAACIDWKRQRIALAALRSGQAARWRPFDWDAFDGSLRAQPIDADPRAIMILEGVYSARPELADLVDLRVLVRVPHEVRMARLIAREGVIGPWERQWHDAEEHYFAAVMPELNFDVICCD